MSGLIVPTSGCNQSPFVLFSLQQFTHARILVPITKRIWYQFTDIITHCYVYEAHAYSELTFTYLFYPKDYLFQWQLPIYK